MRNNLPLMRLFVLAVFVAAASSAFAQSKVKGAYRQYTKGDVAKAYESLMEIELAEAETEYYYVRFLCEIDSAQNGEDFWQLKKWLIEANPVLVEDEKDRERLLKSFDLDESRHLELYEQLYARAFTYYMSINTLSGWKEHNSRYPYSSKFGSSWIYESVAALEEAKKVGVNAELFEEVYRNYAGTNASEEAYGLWVKSSFEAAKAEGLSQALLDFEAKFPQEPEAKEARVLARKMDFESARDLNDIEALEYFLYLYTEGVELDQAKAILAVLYRSKLTRQKLDYNLFKRYRDDYAAYDEEESVLRMDSLFNSSLYQLLLSPEEIDHTKAKNWHKNVERSMNSFGYAIIDRNIENHEERFIPYLDGIIEYSIGLISRANFSGSVKDYRFESIVRDGNSYYSVYMDGVWWPIYVDRQGDVRFLTEAGFENLRRITQGGCLLGYAADNQVIDIFGELIRSRGTNAYNARPIEGGWAIMDWYGDSNSYFEGPIDCINFWNHEVNVVTDGGWSTSAQTVDGGTYVFSESAGGVRTAYNHEGMPIWEHKDLSFENDGLVLNLIGGEERYYVLGDSAIQNPHNFQVFAADRLGYVVLFEPIESVHQDPYEIEQDGINWQVRGRLENSYFEEDWPYFGRFILQDLEGGAQDFKGWGKVEGSELVFKLALNDYLRVDLGALNTMITEKKNQVLTDGELEAYMDELWYGDEGEYEYDEYEGWWYEFAGCEYDLRSWCETGLDVLQIDLVDGVGFETGALPVPSPSHWELGLTKAVWVGYYAGDSWGYFKHPEGSSVYGDFHKDATWKFLERFMRFRCDAISSYTDCEGFEKTYEFYKSQINDLNFPSEFEEYANELKLMFIVETSANRQPYQFIELLNEEGPFTSEQWVNTLSKIAHGPEGYDSSGSDEHLYAREILDYIIEYFSDEGLDCSFYSRAAELNETDGYDRTAVDLWAQYIETGRDQNALSSWDEVNTLNRMGFTYFEFSEYREAIGVWKQALDIAEDEGMEWFWRDGNIFINLSAAHANLNDHEAMCRYLKIALGSGSQEAKNRMRYCD